ncbi:hypothetical protein REPUB_Repub04eG0128700 [Reevesia pubescens]
MSLRYLHRICVRAVQGLKDHNHKRIMAGAKPRSEPGKSSQVRWVSDTREPVKQVGSLDDKQKLRKDEKAENIMHLICWGPCVN